MQQEALLRKHDLRTAMAQVEEDSVLRVIRNQPVQKSTLCRLCGIDTVDPASVEKWIQRYEKSAKCRKATDQKYRQLSVEEWSNVLEDALGDLVREDTFLDSDRKPFFVHEQCALVTWSWQKERDDMPTIVFEATRTRCELCGDFGATCSCAYSECPRAYHSSCALFSEGHVDWGLQPKLRKVPACPRHREMKGMGLQIDERALKEIADQVRYIKK